MDGLECSVLPLRHIRNSGLRFDSDYYSKRNLSLSKTLSNVGNSTIAEYGGILDCSAFYPSITGYYSSNRDNIPFLRVNEINNGLIVITDNTVFLPPHVIEENSNTIALAYPGDIIIAKGGNTLAKVGLVTEEFPMYATCRDVIILRTNELKGLNKYYLWAFLHSEHGQGILWRSASQTGQPHLTLPAIMKIKVPDTVLLQSVMERLYKESVDLKEKAEKCYHDAEKKLLSSLKIQVQDQAIPVVTQKNITESFVRTGRLDAEYYQPKYDEYINLVKAYRGGYTYVKTVFDQVTNKCDRTAPEYKYVEIGDINVHNGSVAFNVISTELLPANAKIMAKKGDVLVSTVRPNRGAVAILDADNLLVSGAFTVLRQKSTYKKEVLQILLRTELYRDWLLRYNVGTSYPVIKDEDVLNMPIPILDKEIQDCVEDKVQKSNAMRQKSEDLLNLAKQAVEMAIEQGEDVALEWLKLKA